MANSEDARYADIVFRGIDGNECEAFIVAIRDLAFAKGKAEDRQWMLQYATTRLRYKALRWHARLDPSAQNDWYLFVQALFGEYPLVEEQDEVGTATPVWSSTTFSPAPSVTTLPRNNSPTARLAGTEPSLPGTVQSAVSLPSGGEVVILPPIYDSSLPGYQMGRFRILYEEGRRGPHYVSTEHCVTMSTHQALIVTFIPSPKAHRIICFDCGDKKLSVRLVPSRFLGFYCLGSTSRAEDPVSMYSDHVQYFSNVWSISHDGTLNAALPDIVPNPQETNYYIPSEYHTTTAVYVELSGASISFVKDNIKPQATHPSSGLPIVRARILFEPI